MLYESNKDYKLYGKTGSGDCWDNKVIGWYVGFVETKLGNYAFALNIIVNEFKDLQPNLRVDLTKTILKELEVID